LQNISVRIEDVSTLNDVLRLQPSTPLGTPTFSDSEIEESQHADTPDEINSNVSQRPTSIHLPFPSLATERQKVEKGTTSKAPQEAAGLDLDPMI
jgi:hypothetical protein